MAMMYWTKEQVAEMMAEGEAGWIPPYDHPPPRGRQVYDVWQIEGKTVECSIHAGEIYIYCRETNKTFYCPAYVVIYFAIKRGLLSDTHT